MLRETADNTEAIRCAGAFTRTDPSARRRIATTAQRMDATIADPAAFIRELAAAGLRADILTAIYSSPQLRARQTAQAIAIQDPASTRTTSVGRMACERR